MHCWHNGVETGLSSHGAICSLWKGVKGSSLRGNISFLLPVAGGSLSNLRGECTSSCPAPCALCVCVSAFPSGHRTRAPGASHPHTPQRLEAPLNQKMLQCQVVPRGIRLLVPRIPLELCLRAGGGGLRLPDLQAVLDPVAKVDGEANRHPDA